MTDAVGSMMKEPLEDVDCPVCECKREARRCDAVGGEPIYECETCGVVFTGNVHEGAFSYDTAYLTSHDTLAELGHYNQHVAQGRFLMKCRTVMPFLTGIERWMVRRVGKVGTGGSRRVLDIGCGAGRLMMALREIGHDVYGIDVADAPLVSLREMGFTVASGTLDQLPGEWPEFEIVVCSEVIEHVTAPVAFMRDIGKRFPRARLLFAVPYSNSRRKTDPGFLKGDMPPNHLTWWTPKAFRHALIHAGLAGRVSGVRACPSDWPPSSVLRQRMEKRLSWRLAKTRMFKSASGDAATTEARARFYARWCMGLPWSAMAQLRGGLTYWLAADISS